MKLAFFSSSPLALPLLQKLQQDFEVVLTVTAKEKMDADFAQKIKDLQIDLAIIIDYGLLIPKIVYQAPKLQTINIHFSLLPKFRGPYPDAFVILNNEQKTGISFVLIDEGFDTGDILAQLEVEIKPLETAGDLHQRLYQEVVKNISYIINTWATWKLGKNYKHYNDYNDYINIFLPPMKQNHKLTTYTKQLGREDGYISWEILHKILSDQKISGEELPELITKYIFCHCEERSFAVIANEVKQSLSMKAQDKLRNFNLTGLPRPATGGARNDLYVHVYNLWRALSPWPGLWTLVKVKDKDLRLKLIQCHLEDEKFVIDQVQLEGKNPVAWKQFQEGYILPFI